jgi:hypothetical protein
LSTDWEVAEEVGISTGSCHTILVEDLGMHQVSVKFVPNSWLMISKEQMTKIFWKMSLPVTGCGFTVKVLKSNNPHTGRVLLWLTPRKHDRCACEWKQCCLFSFNHQGTVHYEFDPEGQTINQDVSLAVLRRLRDAVRRKQPEMWTAGSWLLQHNNAPTHTALSIRQFLTKH